MKKIITTVCLFAFVAISLTSCVKDYTCECTEYDIDNGVKTTTGTNSYTITSKKDAATTSCESDSYESTFNGEGEGEDCTIK